MQNLKAVNLVEYLLGLASLRSKLVRDVADYERILWLNDIPRQRGCFTQAWGRDGDYDFDIWIEVQNRREPELPSIPEQCKDWVNKDALRNKKDLPEPRREITIQTKNTSCGKGGDQPEFITRIHHLDDYPEVLNTWYRYVEECWLSWVEEHNVWESVHKVYSTLFAIHQEQLRLGEEYELVLGIGLLTWQTPTSQRVWRHLIVADAILEFEARLGKFTVRPHTEGAKLRPELDMLDIEEQPPHAEETAKTSLINTGDNPWEKDCVEDVLQALAHSINPHGEYKYSLEPKGARTSDKPIVEYAPAIILRKRSAKGLTETLRKIKEQIEQGEDIPGEFADLAEIRQNNKGSDDDGREPSRIVNDEVFFPKPSNEEQRRIADKTRNSSGVLVQGPPGTGKSHTIANLICHLLATGQRTLITAKTPRALQVLKDLVPEELRPLCINLLGDGLDEKKSLESSVGGILRKNEEWNENQTAREREEFEKRLSYLREEKVTVVRRLRDIRESETHSKSIAEGAYRGTPARIAEAMNRDSSSYEWFRDTVALNSTCPISENDLRNVLSAIRRFTPEKRRELSLEWPESLPSHEQLSNIVESEKRAVQEESNSTNGADGRLADLLCRCNVTSIESIRNALFSFNGSRKKLSASPQKWMRDALSDVMGGNSSLWRELSRATRNAIAPIETLIPMADETSLDFPDTANIRALFEDVHKLKEHVANGGKLGWGPFRPKIVKERVYVLKTIHINGRYCSTSDDFSIISNILRVRIECEKAWGFWVGRYEKPQGPYALQLHTLKALCDDLENTLMIEGLIEKCRETLKQCPSVGKPVWSDESNIERLIASCQLALAIHRKRLAADEIRSIEAPLSALAAKSDAHPITGDLLRACRNRDLDSYAQAVNKAQDLEKERKRVQKIDDYMTKLRRILPKLTDELELNCNASCWDDRIIQIHNAWHWAQAKYWIEEYIRKEDVPALAQRVKQIDEEINTAIAKLASLHAWSFCFSRLTEGHRRHMEAWQQSMRRLGKGTGKHAPRHRREAQQHLTECRQAIPAWVMPLHRVWDTVSPAPGMFDVIIVDEASQCGVEALPLFYLGKKILIVGDDKQISPDAVGLPRDAVHHLMEKFLHDFNFKSSFDIESSLFDHGKLRYGTSRITLREHFRCMPEIIRFSNDLCYADTPLIPLRQYGPKRLAPLEHIFIESGYREGSNNGVMNRPEAEALVEKIVGLCDDQRYSGKTMGVVVLQGKAQAGLIESLLLERLGAEEIERRRLTCGNPYSFQGDERDIIFLSLVAATNERIGPLTKPADERRFNVAASRARDQMWLFHSVRREDLSASDLRRKLLEFFESTTPQQIAGISKDELERRAKQDNRSIIKAPSPFDSWFEVDVALELLRKGFRVNSQFDVAGKRIDLVVEGGQARLAVECDGDQWHGVNRYEEDMERQRQLERCGWEFFRVRESYFYSNKDGALEGLWRTLEERGITV